VVENDKIANDLEISIDKKSIQILSMRQPTPSDLRLMLSIIKITTHLEPIGDEAAKLGKNTLKLSDNGELARQLVELRHLGHRVKTTLNQALTTYARLTLSEKIKSLMKSLIISLDY